MWHWIWVGSVIKAILALQAQCELEYFCFRTASFLLIVLISALHSLDVLVWTQLLQNLAKWGPGSNMHSFQLTWYSASWGLSVYPSASHSHREIVTFSFHWTSKMVHFHLITHSFLHSFVFKVLFLIRESTVFHKQGLWRLLVIGFWLKELSW